MSTPMNTINDSLYDFGLAADASKGGKAAAELGKEDFLQLLVTQLQNQDPLNPSDPTEFTAQLAQYSSLEQLYNINDSMEALDALSGGFSQLSALSMIDKSVVVSGDSVELEGDPVNLGFRIRDDVSGDVRAAVVSIRDASGQVVDEMPVAAPGGGENWVAWDGTDADGQALPPGRYTFRATGQAEDGEEIRGETLVESRVTGVDFSGASGRGGVLLTDNGEVELEDVSRVNR